MDHPIFTRQDTVIPAWLLMMMGASMFFCLAPALPWLTYESLWCRITE